MLTWVVLRNGIDLKLDGGANLTRGGMAQVKL